MISLSEQERRSGDMLELYKNIKARRLELGMSQEELAKKVGYSSRSMIAKIEAGSIDLYQSKIKEIASALNTTPEELMGWKDYFGGKDGKGASSVERFRNSLFYKSGLQYKMSFNGYWTMLNGIYDEFKETDININSEQLYKFVLGNEVIYVKESDLFSAHEMIESFTKTIIKNFSAHVDTKTEVALLNAAHERTDIEVTDEMRKHDDDIMDDENF